MKQQERIHPIGWLIILIAGMINLYNLLYK